MDCFSAEDQIWINQIKDRADESAVEWFREQIQSKTVELRSLEMAKSQINNNNEKKCSNCLQGNIVNIEDPKVLVFMSFSVPDVTWLSLSKELEKVEGAFIIRGLPNHSFKKLAAQIYKLKKQGVNAQILINPILFKQYQIKQAPTFVIEDANYSYKVTGNISLKTVLDLIGERKESELCTSLKEKLHDKIFD